jgi:hypothetical protein
MPPIPCNGTSVRDSCLEGRCVTPGRWPRSRRSRCLETAPDRSRGAPGGGDIIDSLRIARANLHHPPPSLPAPLVRDRTVRAGDASGATMRGRPKGIDGDSSARCKGGPPPATSAASPPLMPGDRYGSGLRAGSGRVAPVARTDAGSHARRPLGLGAVGGFRPRGAGRARTDAGRRPPPGATRTSSRPPGWGPRSRPRPLRRCRR